MSQVLKFHDMRSHQDMEIPVEKIMNINAGQYREMFIEVQDEADGDGYKVYQTRNIDFVNIEEEEEDYSDEVDETNYDPYSGCDVYETEYID